MKTIEMIESLDSTNKKSKYKIIAIVPDKFVIQVIGKVRFEDIKELINDDSFYLVKEIIMEDDQMMEIVDYLVFRIWKASGGGKETFDNVSDNEMSLKVIQFEGEFS
jgi:hypothetical protein